MCVVSPIRPRKYTALIFLLDAGAKRSNSAQNRTPRTGSLTQKQNKSPGSLSKYKKNVFLTAYHISTLRRQQQRHTPLSKEITRYEKKPRSIHYHPLINNVVCRGRSTNISKTYNGSAAQFFFYSSNYHGTSQVLWLQQFGTMPHSKTHRVWVAERCRTEYWRSTAVPERSSAWCKLGLMSTST